MDSLFQLTQMQGAMLTMVIVLGMFAMFLRESYPTEVVAMGGMSVLLVTGVLPYQDAVAVLSNPAPWTIAAMFIIVGALVRTGALNALTTIAERQAKVSPARAIGGGLLFVALASLFTIVPGYKPPTGSLSTTAALALCVFVAVPLFGIAESGLANYLRVYLHPSAFMLPFNIISEVSRTLALALRLFGNMMSGTLILAILLTITPFIFPVVMSALGLLTGMVQAYIFFILATVYIAAAKRARMPRQNANCDINA